MVHLRRPGRPRAAIVVAVVVAALAFPLGVLASHQFPDVPDSNPFHNDIARVYNARIAAGCGGGNFCPSANVTREQMAAFLSRSGGRVGYDIAGTTAIGDTDVVYNTVTIRAGNVSGGTAFVQLIGSYSVLASSATGLPTYAVFYLREQGGGALVYGFGQVDALAEGTFGSDTGTITAVVPVPTGVTKTYQLVGYRAYGTGTLTTYSTELTATYYPFSEDGDATLNGLSLTAPKGPDAAIKAK